MNLEQQPRVRFTDAQLTQLQQLMDAAMASVNLQLQNGEKRMDGLSSDIAGLALKQDVNNVKTEAMYEMFDTAKKGLSVLGTIGNGVKWAAGIAAAVVAVWAALKGKA